MAVDENLQRELVNVIVSGDEAGLSKILESSTDVNELLAMKISLDSPTNHSIGKGATLLQLAAIRERKEGATASQLIAYGATVDIHSACGLGMTDQIDSILNHDPAAIERRVDTYFPLQFAITAGRVDSIDCLMRHRDDPNRSLKKVAYFGWEDDVVDQHYTPWKPIHQASLWSFDRSRMAVVDCLAGHGADLDAVSPLDGYRPIHLAAMSNRTELLRWYVQQGIDVNSQSMLCDCFPYSEENAGPVSGHECTPLMVACGEGFLDAARCLLELGADVDARNSNGASSLDFAGKKMWNGQPYDNVIELLCGWGAK